MLNVEDLLTSVRTGEKRKSSQCVYITSRFRKRRRRERKEGVLSPLASGMRQSRRFERYLRQNFLLGNITVFYSIKMYFSLSNKQKSENWKLKKWAVATSNLGLKLGKICQKQTFRMEKLPNYVTLNLHLDWLICYPGLWFVDVPIMWPLTDTRPCGTS